MEFLWTPTLSQQARQALTPLAREFLLDDPVAGLLAVIPVVGGNLPHPLTGQAVSELTVYAAGADRVKILEPKFLRCLPLILLPGLVHPSQFCALVAQKLGNILRELSLLRQHLIAMKLTVELEKDFLRLHGGGQGAVAGLEWRADIARQIEILQIDGRRLYGSISRVERLLDLSEQPLADVDRLSLLLSMLTTRMNKPIAADEPRSLPAQAEPIQQADSVAVAEKASQPVEVESNQGRSSEESMGPISVALLQERLGPQVEISAHRGRLRLVAPLKVLQGTYTFYLQQEQKTRFIGKMVTPKGIRHPVEVDLAAIADIKEVFDRIIMGV
jgi:hypothetical protein